MPALFDTHCHLNLSAFNADVDEVIARAASCGVEHFIVPGIDIPSSLIAIQLAEKYDQVYASIGIHPSESLKATDQSFEDLEKMAKNNKVVAIGEIGLDFYHPENPSEIVQVEALNRQLQIASDSGLPVILHSRNALKQLIIIIRNHSINYPTLSGSLHAFEGSVEDAREAIELGYSIGIGGPVTYQNAKDKHALARDLAIGCLLIETDAPFLAPSRHRQERNEPSYLPMIATRIAELKHLSFEEVATTTSQNATQLFLRRKSV